MLRVVAGVHRVVDVGLVVQTLRVVGRVVGHTRRVVHGLRVVVALRVVH